MACVLSKFTKRIEPYRGFTRINFAKQNLRGFTMVELLVVIAVIAILSVIGVAIFSSIQKTSRDAVRKGDIEAITKAYELNYSAAEEYQRVNDNNFAAGKIPIPPEGGNYGGLIVDTAAGFQICTALEDHPDRNCDTLSDTCYCIRSSQGVYVASGPTPSPSPSPTSTPAVSPTPTSVPTPTPTPLPTPTPTSAPTPTPTSTPSDFKYIFVSSGIYEGNLGGLTGADNLCQSAASTGGLPGTYKAWLSSSTVSAASRITNHATIPYKRVDGVTVANNWADLTDGTLQNLINVKENGVPVSVESYVWTNTTAGGGIKSTSSNDACSNWTSSGGARNGYFGITNNYSIPWTESTTMKNCRDFLSIYCIQDP